MADTFTLEIATPERSIVHEDAVRAQIPGADGYVGVLPDHAALLGALGIGPLTYATPQGGKFVVAVHGGFLEVLDNHVRVLADAAEPGTEIDTARAQRALDRAKQASDKAEQEATDRGIGALLRAECRLEAARKAQLGEE